MMVSLIMINVVVKLVFKVAIQKIAKVGKTHLILRTNFPIYDNTILMVLPVFFAFS